MIAGLRIVAFNSGPCDLPHDGGLVGAQARQVRDQIRNAGGNELHLCYQCRRALIAEARAEYRFGDGVTT